MFNVGRYRRAEATVETNRADFFDKDNKAASEMREKVKFDPSGGGALSCSQAQARASLGTSKPLQAHLKLAATARLHMK